MWEVRAEPEQVEQLVAFARAHADPTASIYCADGPEPRVVVIDPSGGGLPELPPGLAARPPHVWTFTPVAR